MKPGIGSGDQGATRSLAGRARKSDCLIAATGDVDELNSLLGLVRSRLEDKSIDSILHRVQGELFLVGADLSGNTTRMSQQHVNELETALQAAEAELPALSSFILPAGPPATALLHVARSVCRRAERSAFALYEQRAAGPLPQTMNPHALAYLNRLSDLLFALARLAAKRAGAQEEPWKS